MYVIYLIITKLFLELNMSNFNNGYVTELLDRNL